MLRVFITLAASRDDAPTLICVFAVIGGYIPGNLGVDSLVIGFYRGKDLIYAARVRAGFVPAGYATRALCAHSGVRRRPKLPNSYSEVRARRNR
jgi:hypothetical protein